MGELSYGFFFGAGADSCYGLPSGSKFTQESMLKKRKKLYDALKNFYKEKSAEDFVDSYTSHFLFQRGSAAFRDLIEDAIQAGEGANALWDEESAHLVDAYKSNASENKTEWLRSDNEDLKNFYDQTINDDDDSSSPAYPEGAGTKDKSSTAAKSIRDYFSYHGIVERYFSSIAHPKGRSDHFWKIVNYYWGAYFSVLLPIVDRFSEYPICDKEGLKNNKYKHILNNLPNILKKLWSEDFLEYASKKLGEEENYYDAFSRFSPPACVITTNYTPFVNRLKSESDPIYLAGTLTSFENPRTFEIFDCQNNPEKFNGYDPIFPYMLTQSYIKPIINTAQIEHFHKAIDALSHTKVLIIVGYSLCENDNHINAILRDFVHEKDGIIIYAKHCTPGTDFSKEETFKSVKNSLRLPKEDEKKIIILPNDGNAVNLRKSIKHTLDELSAGVS
jgi:hypothetical protein